jgi:hypothetical protein
MKEVFKCRERRMMRWDEMKYGKKIKLGDAHITPKNIQEVQASKLGDAPRHPFFIGKNQVTFQDTIFLLLVYYAFFLERLYFRFQFSFILFAAINSWTPTYFFWRRHTRFFIAKNTLVFTLIVQRVFSFSSTAFSFHFSPSFLFRSCYIFVLRCIWTTGLCWFSS